MITVASLVGIVGSVLGTAALRGRVTGESASLGAGTAAALGIVDVVYVARRRISPVYLVDAALEFALVAAWLGAERFDRGAPVPSL